MAAAVATARPGRPPYEEVPLDRGRSWELVDEGRQIIRVTDLDLAAYLMIRDLPLAGSFRASRTEMLFYFDLSSFFPEWRAHLVKLSAEWPSSREARYAGAVRALKKSTFSTPGEWSPWKGPSGGR